MLTKSMPKVDKQSTMLRQTAHLALWLSKKHVCKKQTCLILNSVSSKVNFVYVILAKIYKLRALDYQDILCQSKTSVCVLHLKIKGPERNHMEEKMVLDNVLTSVLDQIYSVQEQKPLLKVLCQ